ncbi:hypothetical protein C0989_002293 [Termitomyces sp. Mn162]|nr:hypothetical protein C0989_002293 [Termitomyces sp. Mn162]
MEQLPEDNELDFNGQENKPHSSPEAPFQGNPSDRDMSQLHSTPRIPTAMGLDCKSKLGPDLQPISPAAASALPIQCAPLTPLLHSFTHNSTPSPMAPASAA